MIKFISLGSGSSGNCYYLNASGHGIVIDAGIAPRSFKKFFRDYGLSQAELHALLITHDHTDHVKAAGALSETYHLPVFATEKVHQGMQRNFLMKKKVAEADKRVIQPGETFDCGPCRITPFPVPHDSNDNNGYFIEVEGLRFCLITDAGHITEEMESFIRRADYLVIEANYDEQMLQNGPYPPHLKRRISCGGGHLSNVATAETLARHLPKSARRVWLCHLSEENNHPELARKQVETALLAADFPVGTTLQIDVLKRKMPTGIYELSL
ncbi:MAG: MBL fold metallo-hydrolase [Alloprevotella sp.]